MAADGEMVRELTGAFAIPERLSFAADPGGLPVALVRGAGAEATVDLQGANVTHYRPAGEEPVLWLSARAVYAPGKAIRGGIPICWPWFGAHPSDPSRPDHGFARNRPWSVLGAFASEDGATVLRLGLGDDETSRALWPHRFALELQVSVGAALHVALIARNPGSEPYTCTGALHSYLAVGDVARIAIHGLEGHEYLDKVDGGSRAVQEGPVTIAGETDRIYGETTATCTIDDPVLGRRLSVAKLGSRATVVWNPWREKAGRLGDFGEDAYPRMVCIEAANALDDEITVAPGAEHRLETIISVEHQGQP